MESLIDEVKRLLAERNYVGAGMIIRESESTDRERFEALGIAVGAIVTELEVEKNRERIVYLRTMLSWYFREAPGLSYLYREQLRMIHGRPSAWQDLSNLAKFFRDLGAGAGAGGRSGTEGSGGESTADRAKEFTDRFKSRGEDFQEQMKDFFAESGIDLDEGMRRAGDFFDSLSGKRKPDERGKPRDVDEE